jgi:hypothetical protein
MHISNEFKVKSSQIVPIDVSRKDLYSEDRWSGLFAELRQKAPIQWVPDSPFGPYWSVSTYKPIQYIEALPELFSSSWTYGGISIAFNADTLVPHEVRQPMFIAMDPPQHAAQRRTVAPSFGPSQVGDMKAEVKQRTGALIDSLPIGENFDWVQKVSIELTTGMLAKLGALKTTGEAVNAIATLEERYQRQYQETTQQYNFANQDLEVKYNDMMRQLESSRDDGILKIQSNLSKSEEDIAKEIMKMQADAAKQIFSISSGYAKDFRSLSDKYTTELRKQAEKWAKDFEDAAGTMSPGAFSEFMRGKEGELQRSIPTELYDSYLQEFAAQHGHKLSPILQQVVTGYKDWHQLSVADERKVINEIRGLGLPRDAIKSSLLKSVLSGDRQLDKLTAAEKTIVSREIQALQNISPTFYGDLAPARTAGVSPVSIEEYERQLEREAAGEI